MRHFLEGLRRPGLAWAKAAARRFMEAGELVRFSSSKCEIAIQRAPSLKHAGRAARERGQADGEGALALHHPHDEGRHSSSER